MKKLDYAHLISALKAERRALAEKLAAQEDAPAPDQTHELAALQQAIAAVEAVKAEMDSGEKPVPPFAQKVWDAPERST